MGIKKAVEKQAFVAQSYHQTKQNIPEPYNQSSEDSQRTNPSTIRRGQAPQFQVKERQISEGFHQPAMAQPSPIQYQYQQEPYSHSPQMIYENAQYPSQHQSPENMNQINLMIEEQKKIIQMYQTTLQQIIEFQHVIKPKQESPTKIHELYTQPQSQVQIYMEKAEKSNIALASELKHLYSEFGTMLATKQLEIDNNSKFVKAENATKNRDRPPSDEFGYLNAETYKFNSKLDQSLQGSSKFVKINIQNRPQDYDQDMLEESVPIGDLVETWDEREFDSKTKLQASVQKAKENKFISHSKQVQQNEDDVDDDFNLDDFDREESALKHTNKPEKEAQWQKHKDLLDARNMLAQAMNDAAFLIKNEQDINKLAHQSHKEGQMRQVNDINKELDMIEKMIHDDNESNVKRKPMENSVSTIKSSKKNSVLESSKDPFDKLEELGKELNQEEIEEMRKTAKTNKSNKRKPW